jgi:ABC-2 type transport system ATP-binding protein
MADAVRTDRLSKVYPGSAGRTPALADLSLTVPTGRVFGVIGRNGAGKTTLVRIASTQLEVTSGRAEVLGYDVMTQAREIRRRIACVPQESRPLYFLNVDEVIYLYLKLRGLDHVESRRRTNDALEQLALTEYRKRPVQRLSGGLRRRTLCAMALASDADVLFLDEPTTGLDPIARRQVWEAIRRATRENRTIVLTTHYLDEAEALSSHLALFEKGKLALSGAPEDLRGRVRYPFRVTLQGSYSAEELQSYGKFSPIEGGALVFAREKEARELARTALERGQRVSMGPVTLEDIFVEVVGRAIDDDKAETEAEA